MTPKGVHFSVLFLGNDWLNKLHGASQLLLLPHLCCDLHKAALHVLSLSALCHPVLTQD